MKSVPVELVNASRVGTTKQVKMRVDSKVEIDSPEFGELDAMIGNIGILIIGNDISEVPSDAYVKEELSKVKVDKVIQGKSMARQLKDAIWKAQVDLMDGERPDPKADEEVYRRFMTTLIEKIKDNPELIRKYL